MAGRVIKNRSTVSVRLSKAQLDVIAPGLEQLVGSYRVHEEKGTSPFAYPFRIYPPPRGFDRGTFDKDIMEKILSLAGTVKAIRNRGRGTEIDTLQLRATAFAIRTHIDFVRSVRRQQRGRASEVKVALHVDGKSVAQLKTKAKAVIHALERHQKRANRALIREVGKKQYIERMLAWKAHLRWMRLHIAYYKSWARPVHGRRKRQQRDLDELAEMAELAVRGEDHRAPGKKRLRNLMRLYARYSRSGRQGYWSVRSLLENKDTYRAQWMLAQFVIKRLKR